MICGRLTKGDSFEEYNGNWEGGRKEETLRSRRTFIIVQSFRKVFQFMTSISGITLTLVQYIIIIISEWKYLQAKELEIHEA